MIKPKTGSCSIENCSYKGALITDKCPDHYWAHRRSLKNNNSSERLKTRQNKPDKKEQQKESSKELELWFVRQIAQCPRNCEECGTPLRPWLSWMPKAVIAHILPKRKNMFPTVATHPANRMFYCGDCHTDFDQKGSDHAKLMKSIGLMRERYREIEPHLTEQERNKAPDYLKEL